MQVKGVSCKNNKKPYEKSIQKHHHLLWGKAHLKGSEAKSKTVLWSDESKFEITFGNHGHNVLHAKEERNHRASYQQTIQQPASQMVWSCINPHGTWDIWKGTITEEYIKV